MIQMTPFQTWTTMVLLFALVAALVWLIHVLAEQQANHDHDRAEDAGPAEKPTAADRPLAIVTPMRRPVKPARHLSLVPDLPREPSREPYDWKLHGL